MHLAWLVLIYMYMDVNVLYNVLLSNIFLISMIKPIVNWSDLWHMNLQIIINTYRIINTHAIEHALNFITNTCSF